jgi:Flp pilus assembly pilin Flp
MIRNLLKGLAGGMTLGLLLVFVWIGQIKILNCRSPLGGQTLVEYALILALVTVLIITMLITLGGSINNLFNHISNTLATM